MTNLAIQPKLVTVYQQYGVVVAVGDKVAVQTDSARYQAQCAPSCLLQPEVGDKVLLVTDTEGDDYVLAVLVRAGLRGAQLTLPADTDIQTKGGTLKITGRDGLALQSAHQVSVQSAQLRVDALQGDVTIHHLSIVGEAWRSCIDTVKTVGRSFDSVLERCHARVSRSYRQVQELDQVKAGQIDYHADTSLQLHGKYALVTADELVKMDAEQIHLG
ncbi:MAG: DUF3540 domain-containing protein [Polaromonas sp.]